MSTWEQRMTYRHRTYGEPSELSCELCGAFLHHGEGLVYPDLPFVDNVLLCDYDCYQLWVYTVGPR